MSSRAKLKKTINSLAIRIAGVVIGFATTAAITNYLGAPGFGVYSVIVSVTMFLSILSRYGLDLQVVRDAKSGNWDARSIFTKSLTFSVASSFLIAFIYSLVSKNIRIESFVFPPWMLITNTVGLSALLVMVAFLRGAMFPVVAQVHESIVRPAIFLLIIYILFLSNTATPFAVYSGLGASYFFASIFMFITAIYLLKKSKWENDGEKKYTIKSILTGDGSRNFFIISVTGYVWKRSDLVVAGVLLPSLVVGQYSLALRLSEIMAMLVAISNQVLAPHISKSFNNGGIQGELKDVKKISQFVFLVYAATLILFSFFGDYILAVFGSDFVGAKLLVVFVMATQAVNVFFGPAGMILNMTGNEDYCRRILVNVAILAIPLNVLLIMSLGVWGGAITTLICITVNNYFYSKRVKFLFKYKTLVI
jgi:O-antigen/teichoic acid export membrane protein